MKGLSRKMALLAAVLFSLAGTTQVQAGTAFVHLFEWKWNDIASECENFLGPKGFDAVQISPPNEHINWGQWWARYQPVSYKLDSRSGSEAELRDMVQRCNSVGVKIYADMVVNHTARSGDGGTGVGGTQWWPWNHPNLYSSQDYHNNNCEINDYGNAWEVYNCELSGLPDLNTGSAYVQDTIAGYFNKLQEIGIQGFRLDAAKHIHPDDISSILSKAGNPWTFLEVIGATGEAVQPDQYTDITNTNVTEFNYATSVASNFNGQIKNLRSLGESWGLLPSAKAVVFIDNHDRERGHGGGGTLTYNDGAKYNLANVYMLAFPYGYTKIHSGYDFHGDTDAGPPSGSSNCDSSEWICQHRWNNIANMVGFRNYTIGAWSVDNWWDNGNNQIAFSRGNKGFVVINNEGGTLQQSLYTGLPEGNYCNVLAGDAACSGSDIYVDSNGYADFNVTAMSATAIYGGAMAGTCTDCSGEYSANFASLNFRGTANNWAVTAMTLVADNQWEVTINFDGQSEQRFKFDIADDWSQNYGDNSNNGYLDSTGSDIYTSVIGNYKVQVNDSTMSYTLISID